MAGTLGDMINRITSETQRTDLSAAISSAIQTAISDYEGERFSRINDMRFTLNTAVGQSFYSLPSSLFDSNGNALASGVDLLEVDEMVINLNSMNMPMSPQPMKYLDMYQLTTYTGQPCFYNHFGTQLRICPAPNAIYTLTITGGARLSTLAANSDANAWMTEGEKLIRSRAKVLLYRDVIVDAEGAQRAQMAEAEALESLERKNHGTGRLAAWGG